MINGCLLTSIGENGCFCIATVDLGSSTRTLEARMSNISFRVHVTALINEALAARSSRWIIGWVAYNVYVMIIININIIVMFLYRFSSVIFLRKDQLNVLESLTECIELSIVF